MRQKKNEKTDVIFGIEQGAFLKNKPHTVSFIWSRVHLRRMTLLPPHEKDLKTHLLQGKTRLIDTLVRY